jgi:hypothetical protein
MEDHSNLYNSDKQRILQILDNGETGNFNNKTNLKTVTVSDLHIPFIDDAVFFLFLDFLKDYQPDELILNGNMVEMASFSTHPRKKALVEVILNGQRERDMWLPYAEAMRKACPNAKIVYIGSSCHEGWLDRWANQDGTLAADPNYTLPGFLHFKDFGIEYHAEKYEKKHFLWVHGTAVGQHSGWSAKAEYDYYGKSGCSGHTHRLGAYYKTTAEGPNVWFEIGGMCLRKSWYKIKGKQLINWQQGFLINEFYNNSFSPHLTAIIRDENDKPFFINSGVIYK